MTPLENMLIDHEGLKLKPYLDTVGKLTIGVGRNLDDDGISKEEAIILMQNDTANINAELHNYDWFRNLNNARQDAMIDMAFNLGVPRLLKFENMIAALNKKDYKQAAKEMLASDWAYQVKRRAYDLSEMMHTGEYLHDV